MGVQGLWDLASPAGRRVDISSLENKVIAVDASIWMYHFMKAMRDDHGNMVKGAHVLGFFRRICRLLYLKIKPVFVFDGPPPALKLETLRLRARNRDSEERNRKKAVEKLLRNQLKMHILQATAEINAESGGIAAGTGGAPAEPASVDARERAEGMEAAAANPNEPGEEAQEEDNAAVGEDDAASEASVVEEDAAEGHDRPVEGSRRWMRQRWRQRHGAVPEQFRGFMAKRRGVAEVTLPELPAEPLRDILGVPERRRRQATGRMREPDEWKGYAVEGGGMVTVPLDGPVSLEEFEQLPPKVKYTLLKRAQETWYGEMRLKAAEARHDAHAFVNVQLETFLRHIRTNKEIEKAKRKMAEEVPRPVGLGVSEGDVYTPPSWLKPDSTPDVMVVEDLGAAAAASSGGAMASGDSSSAHAAAGSSGDACAKADGGKGKKGKGKGKEGCRKKGRAQGIRQLEGQELQRLQPMLREEEMERSEGVTGLLLGSNADPAKDEQNASTAAAMAASQEDASEPAAITDAAASGWKSVEDEVLDLFGEAFFAEDAEDTAAATDTKTCAVEAPPIPLAVQADALPDEPSRAPSSPSQGYSETGPNGSCQVSDSKHRSNNEVAAEPDGEEANMKAGLQQDAPGGGLEDASMELSVKDEDEEEPELDKRSGVDTTQYSVLTHDKLAKTKDSDSEEEKYVFESQMILNGDATLANLASMHGPDAEAAILTADSKEDRITGLGIPKVAAACVAAERGMETRTVSKDAVCAMALDPSIDIPDRAPKSGEAVDFAEDAEKPSVRDTPAPHEDLGACKSSAALDETGEALGSNAQTTSQRPPESTPPADCSKESSPGTGTSTVQTPRNVAADPEALAKAALNAKPAPAPPSRAGSSALRPDQPSAMGQVWCHVHFQYRWRCQQDGVAGECDKYHKAAVATASSSRSAPAASSKASAAAAAASETAEAPAASQSAAAAVDVHRDVLDLGEEDAEEIELGRLQAELDDEQEALRADLRRAKQRSDTVTPEMQADIERLLHAFGIPFVRSPSEAEAQCAFLADAKLVDAVATDDSDALVFGTREVYRRLFSEEHRVECYAVDNLQARLGLSQNELIALAMLLGCDYTAGVHGVGIVNGLEIVRAYSPRCGRAGMDTPEQAAADAVTWIEEFKGLRAWAENVADWGSDTAGVQEQDRKSIASFKRGHNNFRTQWSFPKDFPNPNVVGAFVMPKVERSLEPFAWAPVNDGDVIAQLVTACELPEVMLRERLDPALRRYGDTLRQPRITEYMIPAGVGEVAIIRSERMRHALRGLRGEASPERSASPAEEGDGGGRKRRKKKQAQSAEGAESSAAAATPDAQAQPAAPKRRGRRQQNAGDSAAAAAASDEANPPTKRWRRAQRAKETEGTAGTTDAANEPAAPAAATGSGWGQRLQAGANAIDLDLLDDSDG
eukprot:TRINITY_DN100748_c0_g1_i1.p1 TRINITY_DN100748_c0_g1~~TRINITY_DN100748_c0_g1_i1.p1  ORF type:complete len:1428 (-),score=409.64 TRINITY_DN100748_c0_g1_i1:328-4611(-)